MCRPADAVHTIAIPVAFNREHRRASEDNCDVSGTRRVAVAQVEHAVQEHANRI